MGRFRLRLRATEINLPIGDVLIGRGPECFLRINEPLVSRRHARLRISPERVIIEDLGSRNGSQVNGVSVTDAVILSPGDLVSIGSQHFTLEYQDTGWSSQTGTHQFVEDRRHRSQPSGPINVPVSSPSPVSGPTQLRSAASMPGSAQSGRGRSASSLPPPVDATGPAGGHCSHCGTPLGESLACPRCGQLRPELSEAPATTARGSSFRLFWALSDKVLAMGRVEDAERMMGPRLRELLERAEAGELQDEPTSAEILNRGLRLAAATRGDRWFAWIFDYARASRYRLSLSYLDEVYALMFTCRPAAAPEILSYAQMPEVQEDEALLLRLSALRKLCRE